MTIRAATAVLLIMWVSWFDALSSAPAATGQATRLRYPPTRAVDVVDDYFGTKVADPYRWLEDADSAEARTWIDAQNELTFSYLATIPERERIRRRLSELWNYERYGVPTREGSWYLYSRNDGLQNQPVLYKAKRLDAEPEGLLDPNRLSPDGTVALSAMALSDDGRHLAYATSASGSDWQEWRVREVETGRDLDDVVRWSKFSGAAWRRDGSGFYYNRYEPPAEGALLQGVNRNQKVYFHALGTSDSEDRLIYEQPDQPDWVFEADVMDDGRFLVIYQYEGTDPRSRVFLQDLADPESGIVPLLDRFDAEHVVVGNDGDRFYVHTDQGAPRKRLVAVERHRPSPADWRTIIPEAPGRSVLSRVIMAGDRFVTVWLVDAHETLRVYRLDGSLEREIALPGLGALPEVTGRRRQAEVFYAFTSFTRPTTIYRYDVGTGRSEIFREPRVQADLDAFETTQVFYRSKDGTEIPMFLTSRHGAARTGVTPTHSFKFAAALQAAQGGDAPALIRIETKAGHGAGKPTSKQIDEWTDMWAFLVRVLEIELT